MHYCYHTVIKTVKTGFVRHYFGKHTTKDLNDGYVGSGKIIKQILNKEKKNPGTYEIICTLSKPLKTEEHAYEFEELLIEQAREKYGKAVINIANGGDGVMTGRTHTEETKKKMSAAHKGRTFSDESIDKMRTAGKGRVHSECAKNKIRESHRGKAWQYYEEILLEWKSIGSPGHRKLRKHLVNQGYPDQNYQPMVYALRAS